MSLAIGSASRNLTVVAAGEVPEDQPEGPADRRFAIEDYLGCGAILSELAMELTPEAELCRRAFESCCRDYARLVRESQSGLFLRERGMECDITHCVQRNIYDVVPTIREGRIIPYA